MSRTTVGPKAVLRATASAALAVALLGACSEGSQLPRRAAAEEKPQGAESTKRSSPAADKPKVKAVPVAVRKVDPRRGGFELGLGEWALTPEARAIRPGKVTFVVRNRGTMGHGFEIALEGDSSGSGSGDLFKSETRLLQPGESTRMTVTLGPGVYEIECLVDGHDDMGMETVLEVRPDAPLVKVKAAAGKLGEIDIEDFAFAPSTVIVPVDTEVTWHNRDPADHTVTALEGGFGSETVGPGDVFTHRFDRPGEFAYRCAIHPEMEGKVLVR